MAHSLATPAGAGRGAGGAGLGRLGGGRGGDRFARELYEELGKAGSRRGGGGGSPPGAAGGGPAGGPDKDVAELAGAAAGGRARERCAATGTWPGCGWARTAAGRSSGAPRSARCCRPTTATKALLEGASRRRARSRHRRCSSAGGASCRARRRDLAGGEHAGVLLHGLGRLGKSSLAARIASRRPDLTLAVTVRPLRCAERARRSDRGAATSHKPACDLLARAKAEIGRAAPDARPRLLEDAG